MVLKCKICGGDVSVQENSKVAICEYCGKQQVLPNLQSETKTRLYERANHFRTSKEYEKALALYEQILIEDSKDAEIYWQMVLCAYGVEYVKDRKQNSYIPTCNRTQMVSVFSNPYYKQAIQYAEEEQKRVYEEEAQKIENIQKNALEIVNKEEAFDIFICYKETDEKGNRTVDSVLAQEIYQNLTKQGYKVFFSKITLEGKLGTQYEPYIFAALRSAKVMVVIGTKKEHFQSVWVKNEWSRFLTMAKEQPEKLLLPVYKDMDPYDLPEEFAHLQALDLGRIGTFTDLQEKIKVALSKNGSAKLHIGEKKNTRGMKKWILCLFLLLILLIGVVIGKKLYTDYIVPEMQYKKAEDFIKEEQYSEAISILEELKGYKESKAKIEMCNSIMKEKKNAELKKYIGTYDCTQTEIDPIFEEEIPMGYVLEITQATSAGISFHITNCGRRIAEIETTAKWRDGTYKFFFQDSWENSGEGTLELTEEGVIFNLKINKYDEMANFSIGEGNVEFKFSDKVEENFISEEE